MKKLFLDGGVICINDLIVSFQKRFKLFRQPDRIGSVINYENNYYLIIGIEKVWLVGWELRVIYTCQNLEIEHDYSPLSVDKNIIEFIVNIDITQELDEFDKRVRLRENIIPLGTVFEHEEIYYQWLKYSDVKIVGKNLQVNALAQIVRPMTMKQSKKHLLNHRKETIGMKLI